MFSTLGVHYLTNRREATQREHEEYLQYRPLRLVAYKDFLSSMHKADLQEGPVYDGEAMLHVTDEIIPEIKLISTESVRLAAIHYFNADLDVIRQGLRHLGVDDLEEFHEQAIAYSTACQREFLAATREELRVPQE